MEHLLLYENKTDSLEAQENFIMSIYIEKAFINIIIIKVQFYQFKRIETTEKRIVCYAVCSIGCRQSFLGNFIIYYFL